MSLRLRLTLWYGGLLAAILIAFGVALYSTVSISSYQEVDRALRTRANDIQASVATVLAVQSDPWMVIRQGGLVLPSADVFAQPEIYVQLSTLDGDVMTRSENLGAQKLVIPREQIAQVRAGESVFSNFTVTRTRLRAYVAPLLSPKGEVLGVIELAQSLRTVDATLADLATLIIVSIAAALAIAGLGGALIARAALAPVDRMITTAHQITQARDLGRRLEVPKTQDEVGRLATTVNEMLSRIEELFRAQQRFVADVSHELRSPLTAIRGNLDLLKRGALEEPEAKAEALEAVDSEVERMSRLVSDLLLLARSDAGVPLTKLPVELDTLLLEVYRQAQIIAKGLRVTLGSEDQAIIMGDRDKLKQVLLNLVENAVKFTPVGGQVRLSLSKDEAWVRITIEDTGIGIPAEDIPHLFNRFYRVDRARSRDAGGTGLGLAIAKSVVDAHGGKITVESLVGKGSMFTVWLPLSAAKPAPTPLPEQTPLVLHKSLN